MDDWAKSMKDYFWTAAKDWATYGGYLRFNLNVCNTSEATLKKEYNRRLAAIDSHFQDPSRAGRLLKVDYLNDPLAAKKVCEHALSLGDERCNVLTEMPESLPDLMTDFATHTHRHNSDDTQVSTE